MKRFLLFLPTICLLTSLLFFASAGMASAHSTQSAQPACSWNNVAHTNASDGSFTLIIWQYSCDGGIHAQLVAHRSGNFYVELDWGGGYLTSNGGNIGANQSLNTNTYHLSTGSYNAYGSLSGGGSANLFY